MTNQQQIHKQLQKPAQASSKASGQTELLKGFRIEASNTDPTTRTGFERGNLHDYFVVLERSKAREHARTFWRAGYWVEVFDNESNELPAGAIDPDGSLPYYIVKFFGGIHHDPHRIPQSTPPDP